MSLQTRLGSFISSVGADIKTLDASLSGKVASTDTRLLANTVTLIYTTTVPARPVLPAGYYVVWQGTADPAANALPGDRWDPV